MRGVLRFFRIEPIEVINGKFRLGEDMLRFVDRGGIVIILTNEEIEIGMT